MENAFRRARATLYFVVLAGTLLLIRGVNAQTPPLPKDQTEIHVFVSVMDPHVVADTFGKRIAQRFVAIQVTIGNHNKDYQYLINDVSLNLEKVFPNVIQAKATAARQLAATRGLQAPNQGNWPYTLSSAELSLLRGVAEKGQGQDTRNKTLRFFRGIGTIAAGLIGVASFGPSYPKSVAVFNGPVISAFSEAFPDYTINQMNRLSDSAYQANTLVPQKHSKVIVAFVPQGILLNKQQQKLFWDDPTSLYEGSGKCSPCVDFRLAEATIDGDFITTISNLPPAVTTVVFAPGEELKFQNPKPIVKGHLLGRFVTGTAISLLNQNPKGLSVALDGAVGADRLNFILSSDKPVPPGTNLEFEVANANGVQRYTKTILYMPDAPTLTAISPNSGKQDSAVTLTLTGTNFIPGTGNTRVNISGADVEVSEPFDVIGNSLKVTLRIGGKAVTGDRSITVVNANSVSPPIVFKITPAAKP